jgi:hypothetical protein
LGLRVGGLIAGDGLVHDGIEKRMVRLGRFARSDSGLVFAVSLCSVAP